MGACSDNVKYLEAAKSSWEQLGLLRTVDSETHTAAPVQYAAHDAEQDLVVLSFKDGITKVGIVRKGQCYLVFAVTRFKVRPADRDWAYFMAIKFQRFSVNDSAGSSGGILATGVSPSTGLRTTLYFISI